MVQDLLAMTTDTYIAAIFGCTAEQVAAQKQKNAAQLRDMEIKARSEGKKINNYTAEQLAAMADRISR